jgi:succinate-acetate transporter protein
MGMTWLLNLGCCGETLAASADIKQLGFVFAGYFILTVLFTISAVKMPKVMFVLLFFIAILFLGLSLDSFGCGHIWHKIAAISELTISLLAFYMLAAKYLNTMFGKEVVWTGKPFCS